MKALTLAGVIGFALTQNQEKTNCFVYRDDIGAFWGIKGYEEMCTEVGTHRGHHRWPQFSFLGTYDSGSVRRGFWVYARNCGNCHGMMYKKYDVLLTKAFKQLELASIVADNFTIHPAHQFFKQHYYQEWDERDRVISDHIYPPYYSMDQAKNANGGVWPTDFSKIRFRPGGINYLYNLSLGYGFRAPFGTDVPKGKHFNPYFDHMIIGMAKQLNDGMLDYDDGTPASAPQLAFDVSNFILFMQRRSGHKRPDKQVRFYMIFTGFALLYPFKYFKTKAFFRNLLSVRYEMYAVRDGLYYKHFKTGQINGRGYQFRGTLWA